METTANLDLPYILPSQAQKHVTHNEALELLDALVQCTIISRDLASPPATPQEGARYIIATDADADWAGQENSIALRRDGGWRFLTPRQGWIGWVIDEHALICWTGTNWEKVKVDLPPLQNLALLGLGTTADTENPFAAKLNKALWTALMSNEGGDGDLRFTFNKEGTTDVLSLLMQSNWSGRAEIGLVGDDDLTFKVSANGADWKEALRIDRHSGQIAMPQTNLLRDVDFNVLPDSGRFSVNTTQGLETGAFAFPPYFVLNNGTTASDGGKFILNNTDYGGTAGTLSPFVKNLVDMIRSPDHRRYGPEYRVAQMTMGTGKVNSLLAADANTYYLSTGFASIPRFPSQTFHIYIRALDAPLVWAKQADGQIFIRNGIRSSENQIITPGEGWVSITMQDTQNPYNSFGYIPRPMMLYASTAGDRYLLACSALMPGITDVDDNVGVIPNLNFWLS